MSEKTIRIEENAIVVVQSRFQRRVDDSVFGFALERRSDVATELADGREDDADDVDGESRLVGPDEENKLGGGAVVRVGAGAREPVDQNRENSAERLFVVGSCCDGGDNKGEEGQSCWVVDVLLEAGLGDVTDSVENSRILSGGGDESGARKHGSVLLVGAEEFKSCSVEVQQEENADEETLVVRWKDQLEHRSGVVLVNFENANEILENLECSWLENVGAEEGEEFSDGGADDFLGLGRCEHGALFAGVSVAEEERGGAAEAVVERDERAETDEGELEQLLSSDVAGFVGIEENRWDNANTKSGRSGFVDHDGVSTARSVLKARKLSSKRGHFFCSV